MQPHLCSTTRPLPLPLPLRYLRHLLPPPHSAVTGGAVHRHDRTQKLAAVATMAKKKDNPWSVDNDLAAAEQRRPDRKSRGKRRVKAVGRRRGRDAAVLVSGSMLMETETVLQTQEPVVKPSWNTFASSVCGIWKGVAAVFSPLTAQMEPVGVGNRKEYLYDGYTLSQIEKVPPVGLASQIRRKTNWVTLNPFGEKRNKHREGYANKDGNILPDTDKEASGLTNKDLGLPSFESFDFGTSELLEEDLMSMDPGLVFFEDGSYSRGPLNITSGDIDESKYFLSPTFKFEQCLVKGCHKRLRIVHTIEFNEGGSNIEITRVSLYEERWVSPVNFPDEKDTAPDLKPVSQRRRTQPSELTGSWKVFEVSATPIFAEDIVEGEPAMVYLCTETLKKRSLPESSTYFREEEALDLQDVTVLWLPGGVTAYVDVSKDGVLCIGVGWYSDEGINLVMERDYGVDGKLKEVRSKSEVKRRWTETPSP